ncbi:MAG: ABC transporter permease [Bacilli bacterium]
MKKKKDIKSATSELTYKNYTPKAGDFDFLKNNETEVDKNYSSQNYWKDTLTRFFKNKMAVIALVVILIIVLLAIFGPMMNSYAYDEVNSSEANFAPRIPGLEWLPMFDGSEDVFGNKYELTGKLDVYYWFGSDHLGRDIWTRTWQGTRISLIISLFAVAIDMVIGMSYGLISGFFGGKVDSIMSRFEEIINSIPTLVIVTLLMMVLKPGLGTIIVALMITGWIGMSRISRAQMFKLKEQEFVLVSRTLGAGNMRLIFKDILPNIIGQLITNTMFSIPNAIFTEAFLSFVGLGIPAPEASLGSLISDAYSKSFLTHPYQILPPLIVLGLLMLSFNILADGLRDALDPRLKQV